MNPEACRRWFWVGCALELSLLAIAAVIGRVIGQPAWADLRWRASAAATGCLAAGPMLAGFWVLLQSSWAPLVAVRDFLERVVRPVFGTWSVSQLAVIALVAGVGEEALFRGAVQAGLTRWVGVAPAILIAGLLFGACHWVTWAYAVIAALLGIYLGTLFWWSGNLLAPVTAHALYDFLALAYFLRLRPPGDSIG